MITAVLVCLSGIGIALYYFLFFDIAAPGSHTINLGLMSERQNGIILGMGLAIFAAVGAIALKFTLKNSDETLAKERLFYAQSLRYATFAIVLGVVVFGIGSIFSTYIPIIQSSIAGLFQPSAGPAINNIVSLTKPDSASGSDKRDAVDETNYHFVLTGVKSKDAVGAWRFYRESNGAYVLVNKSMPYRGRSEGFKYGCQGVVTDDSAPTSVDHILWTDAISWDALNSYQLISPEQVPYVWRTRLERMASLYLDPPVMKKAPIAETDTPSKLIEAHDPGAKAELAKTQAELSDTRRELERVSEQVLSASAQASQAQVKNSSMVRAYEKLCEYNNKLLGEIVEKRTLEREEARLPNGVLLSATKTAEMPEVAWADVRNFYPKAYKNDIEQRLLQAAVQSTQGRVAIDFTKAEVHFTIERDGRPTQIRVSNADGGTRGQKECAQFVEIAGPYRPLISPDLNSVQIEAKLVCDSDLVQIGDLELQANQHRY